MQHRRAAGERSPRRPAAAGAVLSFTPLARADSGPGRGKEGHHSFAIIGDVPYGVTRTATPEQLAEEQARMANGIKVVRNTFAQARQRHDRAVMVLLHADLFDPTYTPNFATHITDFQPLVQALVDESSAFHGQVYLVNGDTS